MKSALLVLVLISVASAAEPAKKRVKLSPQPAASSPNARLETKKVVFTGTSDGLTRSGGADITGGGESILGAGISRGAADKPGSANAAAGGGGGGGGGGGSAGSAPMKSFEKAKVLVSNSPTGPFAQNGTVCSEGQVYTRTTGLDRTKPPMGCASPFESEDCLDIKNHRRFEPNEWLDPFTIQTVVTGSNYPQGKYGMYLSYSATNIKRVGFATLKSCAPPAPAAPAAPAGCRWETHEAVIGPCGGPGCSGTVPCTAANQGATGQGGGGTWTCICR